MLVDNVPSIEAAIVTVPLVDFDDVSSDGCSDVTALLADEVSSELSVVEASFGEVVGTEILSLVISTILGCSVAAVLSTAIVTMGSTFVSLAIVVVATSRSPAVAVLSGTCV